MDEYPLFARCELTSNRILKPACERLHLSFGHIDPSFGVFGVAEAWLPVRLGNVVTFTEPTFRRSHLDRLIGYCLHAGRASVVWATLGMLAAISFADWAIRLNISLGVLYLLPMMLAATVLNALEIFALAEICAILRLLFDYSPTTREETILRFLFASFAYICSGLFVTALIRNRRLMAEHMGEIQREQTLRREAEEQLRVLVHSSPAGILTLDQHGVVLAANKAADMLFAMPEGATLRERCVREYLPVLADALQLDIGADPFTPLHNARAGAGMARFFWPILGFPPTGLSMASGSPPSLWIHRKRCVNEKRKAFGNSPCIAGSPRPRSLTKFGICVVRSH